MKRTRSRRPLLGVAPALVLVVWLAWPLASSAWELRSNHQVETGDDHPGGGGTLSPATDGSSNDSLGAALMARMTGMPRSSSPSLRGTPRARRAQQVEDTSDWRTWYRYNAAPIENLKETIYAPVETYGALVYYIGSIR